MRAFPGNDERMSVLHQDSGGIGKSIPSALEISLGHGFCTPRPSGFPSGFALGKSLGSRGAKPTASENLSDFPRPSRFPSGFALGKSLGSREIGRRGWISQYLPRLGGARIHSLIITREGLILTLSIHLDLQGWIWCPSLPAGEYWPILSLGIRFFNTLPAEN